MPGVKAHPSRANFILFELGGRSAGGLRGPLRPGVLVRDVTRDPGLPTCLRVSVGTDDENAAFLAALAGDWRGALGRQG